MMDGCLRAMMGINCDDDTTHNDGCGGGVVLLLMSIEYGEQCFASLVWN